MRGKSADTGKNGSGHRGSQIAAAESLSPESEIPDGRPAAEILSRTAGTGQRQYLGFAGGSCAGGADCVAQRRICGNGSAGQELCRKGSGGGGDSQRLPEPEGHADDFIGAISRLYDGADAGKLREGLRPDSQRRKEPPGPAGNRSPGKSSADRPCAGTDCRAAVAGTI